MSCPTGHHTRLVWLTSNSCRTDPRPIQKVWKDWRDRFSGSIWSSCRVPESAQRGLRPWGRVSTLQSLSPGRQLSTGPTASLVPHVCQDLAAHLSCGLVGRSWRLVQCIVDWLAENLPTDQLKITRIWRPTSLFQPCPVVV